jgi:hypothetical protein
VVLNLASVDSSRREDAFAERWRSFVSTATAFASTLAFVLPFVAGRAQALPPDRQCEVHVKPSIGIRCGDHKLDISATSRFRTEIWDAFTRDTDTFYGIRTRVGAKYSFRDIVTLFTEFQDTRIYDLSSRTSGAGALYRRFGGADGDAKSDKMRQYWAEIRPIEGLSIRGGRLDIKLGTQALYPEANWKYLKVKRASQRLVGTVGWTHVERSNDGGSIAYDTEGYHFYGFGGLPTTGVFETSRAYRTQDDIVYGGLSVTAKRGTWADDTEFRGFFLGYRDDRPIDDGGLPGLIEVYTLGMSAIGIYPLGPGNVDILLWAAGQAGRFNSRDHLAGAFLTEVGYQFTEVAWKPWYRFGINVASGGDDNGDHKTFFNMLPTNHLYYGFADLLAFQNLVDLFVQLQFKPHEKVGVNVMFHQFYLATEDDLQYRGTGAFNKEVFGFPSRPSHGSSNYGKEIDTVVNVNVCKGLSVQGGYMHFWGDNVVKKQRDNGNINGKDVDFGYVQVTLKY